MHAARSFGAVYVIFVLLGTGTLLPVRLGCLYMCCAE
jgi:hypothetical protein